MNVKIRTDFGTIETVELEDPEKFIQAALSCGYYAIHNERRNRTKYYFTQNIREISVTPEKKHRSKWHK